MQGKGGQRPKKLLPVLQDPVPFGTPWPNGLVDRVPGPVKWRPGPREQPPPLPRPRRCNTGSEKPQREPRRPRLALTPLCSSGRPPETGQWGLSPHPGRGQERAGGGNARPPPAPVRCRRGRPFPSPPLAQARVEPWGKLAGSLPHHRAGRQLPVRTGGAGEGVGSRSCVHICAERFVCE